MTRKKSLKWRIQQLIVALIFLIGMGILTYPLVANYINQRAQTVAIVNYEAIEQQKSQAKKTQEKKEAALYNQRIKKQKHLSDPFAEKKAKKIDMLETGTVLGYIKIPKLEIKLAIYNGTTTGILQKGVGLLQGSSLPTGGKGTHTVLTAHRGIPKARLFRDLDLIKPKDYFTITAYGKNLHYQVDQIKVVKPTDVRELVINESKDYMTLITCTPYMVNSHRLLVRGHRVPFIPKEKQKIDQKQKATNFWKKYKEYIMAFSLLSLFLMILLVKKGRNYYQTKKSK